MIKIKSFGFQADNVETEIEFDLGAQTYTRTVSVLISQLLNMDVDQIKAWVINFVAGQRRDLQEGDVQALLNPLINVDLEA